MGNGIVISKDAPRNSGVMWAKPVSGGFALYLCFNGRWQPLKNMDDNSTATVADDVAKVLLKVIDIEALTTKQCNSLNVGDQVVKITGAQKHLYTVTYKEDKKGLCLSYIDAENAETVAYDYNTTTKKWEFTDKTVTPLT